MPKTTQTPNPKQQPAQPERVSAFAGFNDWIELFRAGHQVDSAGQGRDWTTDDLDQIVSNHSDTTAAPIVVGHPKADAPAYGWAQSLKRDGDVLYGKFNQVEPTFEEWVKTGRYRRRSVAIGEHPENGYYLRHVGWLGAAAPAIKGLADVQFADAATLHEFSYEQAVHLSGLARLFRGIRDVFVERFGADAADKALPDWELDSLSRQSVRAEDDPGEPTAFIDPPQDPKPTETVMPFSQEELDAAVATAREEERTALAGETNTYREKVKTLEAAAKQQEAEREVSALVDAGKVLPSQSAGMVEFVAELDNQASLEFSEGTETKKTNPREWFLRTFMANQPKVVPLGKRQTEVEPLNPNDLEALRRKAGEFQEQQRQAGRDITFTDAWEHVKKEASQ